MTIADPTQPSAAEQPDPTIEQLQADRAATRERLAASVEELAAKADVKARAKDAASETVQQVRSSADQALDRARELPAPVFVVAAVGAAVVTVLLIRRRRGRR